MSASVTDVQPLHVGAALATKVEDVYVRGRRLWVRLHDKGGNHTFRATGITVYLKNGGTLENAAAVANHASTRRPVHHGGC